MSSAKTGLRSRPYLNGLAQTFQTMLTTLNSDWYTA